MNKRYMVYVIVGTLVFTSLFWNFGGVADPPSPVTDYGSAYISSSHFNISYANITRLRSPTSGASSLVIASSTSINKYHANYICDGSDDHTEINNAINALPVGGCIVLLNGTYTIGSSVTLNKPGVTLRGCGDNTVIRAKNALNNPLLYVTAVDVTIKDLYIDGNNAGQSGDTWGIRCDSDNLTVDDVHIYDTYDSGGNWGIRCKYSNNSVISNCYLEKGKNGLVFLDSDNVIIEGNIIKDYSNDGAQFLNVTNGVINNNYVDNCDNDGIHLYSGDVSCSVSGNTINAPLSAEGIQLGHESYTPYAPVKSCSVTGNSIYCGGVAQYGIYVTGQDGYDTVYSSIVGNTIYDALNYGCYIQNQANYTVFNSNTIYGSDAGAYGVHLKGDMCIVSGNLIVGSFDYGLRVHADAVECTVIGNACFGTFASSAYVDGGTDTVTANNNT